ncbi:MAG: hypothetical protein AMJ94_18610, partial [Deltaproteobacteria bacterium SM23_61]
FNAEACRVDNGYLILVNSGLLFFLKQIIEALNMGREFDKVQKDEEVITTIAQAILTYLRFRDPVFGPTPLAGGLKMFLVMFLTEACEQFVLAHEYGHILSGHLDGQLGNLQVVRTKVGDVEIIKNDWKQEFEADDVGYELLIGGKDAGEIDFDVIDQAKGLESIMTPEEVSTVGKGARLMAALAAPLLFFTIESLVTKTWLAIHKKDAEALLSRTHPPSEIRLDRIRKRISWIPMKYLGHAIYPAVLVKMTEAITERVKALL